MTASQQNYWLDCGSAACKDATNVNGSISRFSLYAVKNISVSQFIDKLFTDTEHYFFFSITPLISLGDQYGTNKTTISKYFYLRFYLIY